jgi:hypothetical protein
VDKPHNGLFRYHDTLSLVLALLVFVSLASTQEALGQTPSPTECRDLLGLNPSRSDVKSLMLADSDDDLRRLAIIVGNDYLGRHQADGTYQPIPDSVPPLKNPTNDARAIARLLNEYHYKVECFLNVTADVNERILNAATEIGDDKTNGLTIYYFAGHGFAYNDQTYAVGDGATLESIAALERASLPISSIMSFLHSRSTPVIAIFDMCRERLRPEQDEQGRQIAQDLSPYKPLPSAHGALIQYSTSPTSVANDLPKHSNGLYAMAFLANMPHEPGTPAETFLNDRLGSKLATGIDINGTIYKQVPNVVAYPDDWERIAIFDITNGAYLDNLVHELRDMSLWVDNNDPATLTAVCQLLIQARDTVSAAPEHPAGAHFSATEVLAMLDALTDKISGKGHTCGKTQASAQPTSYTIPPIVYASTTPTTMTAHTQSGASTERSVSAGTWIVTSASSIVLRQSSQGLPITYAPTIDLTQFFTPGSVDRVVNVAGKKFVVGRSPAVYSRQAEGTSATLISTADQVLLRFEPGEPDLAQREKTKDQLRTMMKFSANEKFLLIWPELNNEDRLDSIRLKALRVGSVLSLLRSLEVPLDRIIVPRISETELLNLTSLTKDEMLVKGVTQQGGLFQTLNTGALRSSSVSTVQSLSAYLNAAARPPQ